MLGEFVWVCWEECFKRLQNHYIPGRSRRLAKGLDFYLLYRFTEDAFVLGKGCLPSSDIMELCLRAIVLVLTPPGLMILFYLDHFFAAWCSVEFCL